MRCIIVLVVFLSSISGSGQEDATPAGVEQGKWSIGGSAMLNWSQAEDLGNSFLGETDTYQLGLRPKTGYAIAENWILGLSLGYSFSRTKTYDPDLSMDRDTHSAQVMPFLKRYFGITNRLAFNAEFGMGYERAWGDDRLVDSSELTYHTFFAHLSPGLSYFLRRNIALEATAGSLRYSRTRVKAEGNELWEGQGFEAEIGLSNVYFGITVFF